MKLNINLEIKKILIILLIGFIGYMGIEIMFNALLGTISKNYWELKGITSIWMGCVGSILLLCLGLINEIKILRKLPMIFHALIGSGIITLIELISGIILNVWLHFNIWSYSNLPFNFMGQICLLYSFFWFLISPLAFYIDDTCRWVFYKIDNSEGTREEFNLLDYYQALLNFKSNFNVKK